MLIILNTFTHVYVLMFKSKLQSSSAGIELFCILFENN